MLAYVFVIFSCRSYYIMCMMAITFLNLIGIPMEIAFLDGNSGLAWEGFNVFSDTLFLIDVALNFRMGIITEDGEEAILDIKRIRVSYLRTWFIPDVIAAFPIGYILLFAVIMNRLLCATNKMMRILMFVRILSLIRLARVSRLVRFFNEVSNANLEVVRLFFRILSLFMMIFLLCHWNGCIQYFVPMLEEFPTDCWHFFQNATVIVKYSWGVFRALSQMIALSYGSMDAPTSENYRFSLSIAKKSTYISHYLSDINTFHFALNRFWCATCFIIISYFPLYSSSIYNIIFVFIFQQILMVMCSRLLRNVPLFQNRDENFINAVLLKLEYEVFLEGDAIIRQNVPGNRMFFIDHGQVLMETDSYERELCDGDYFGGEEFLFLCSDFEMSTSFLYLKIAQL
uniref:Hyperpolarization activated cyclic nucleotide-gated potassium channel 5 n=1 Tax=Dicentrarchus labrax TaxID=13489 RepID=A0A8C4EQ57_DICLA